MNPMLQSKRQRYVKVKYSDFIPNIFVKAVLSPTYISCFLLKPKILVDVNLNEGRETQTA